MKLLRGLTGSRALPILRRHTSTVADPPKPRYDVVVVGGGHNGLVAAAYLAKAGKKVCVLESRSIVGGAATTEMLVPGFKFSRASYVLSLLRPIIYEDLELEKHGLLLYRRDPHSFTPLLDATAGSKHTGLLLGSDKKKNAAEIAAYSQRDALKYSEYTELITRCGSAMQLLLDAPPFNAAEFFATSKPDYSKQKDAIRAIWTMLSRVGGDLDRFFEMVVAPAAKILNQWFDSEPLKATLATNSLIGMLMNPNTPGSAYVLIHHCMGTIGGEQGSWCYVKGGMGAVSESLASACRQHGVEIFTGHTVDEVLCDQNGVKGVVTDNGLEIRASMVMTNCTPAVTFNKLVKKPLSVGITEDMLRDLKHFSYASGTSKINFAVKELPNFRCRPNSSQNVAMPHHRGSIRLNCESMQMLDAAFDDLTHGMWSHRPLVDLTIPSVYDSSLAPSGQHVVQCFIQFTPYKLQGNKDNWTDERREDLAALVTDWIDQYAPGFRRSVIGQDILSPVDLEREYGLTGGSIFHGALSLDQIYFNRPARGLANYRTPIKGLYLCGSGSHPGGGVSGGAGRLAARTALQDQRRK